jgi:Rps23 Pro-64 3,4-dihydroxylase Tpa1-like proline 4-hydroxylase
MKRKLSGEDAKNGTHPRHPTKKRNGSPSKSVIEACFRSDLFANSTLTSYKTAYKASQPYPHAVIPSLISAPLLESVRHEITTHISFTLKETDIYRIHQSGDLANLSNLDSGSLSHLPSLLKLRDALYSPQFRAYLSDVTGAGKLSGKKTDMAVNVYTPGSYLLCHDDVIGSRRVSYILYLTDPAPDKAWRPEWGGGLRLYPSETRTNEKGEEVKVPMAEHSLNIPPSFGQLSFFAVRPGESFHDVEEVYHPPPGSSEPEGSRIRMAISGWYHIPQKGEDGYEEGAEEAQAQRSSLAQLEGNADEFDLPKIEFAHFDEPRVVTASNGQSKEIDPGDEQDVEDTLTEQDLTFLLDYITPSFLIPDMTETLSSSFEENSFLQLHRFLCDGFAKPLREYLEDQDSTNAESNGIADRNESWQNENWQVARPPHKHRFLFLQIPKETPPTRSMSPLSSLLVDLLRSHAFKKWLALITGLKPSSLPKQNAMGRRFRRGKDYALANTYQGDEPRLEFTIGMTPSGGWEDQNDAEGGLEQKQETNGHTKTENGDLKVNTSDRIEVGGEEVYMAGDDDDDAASAHSRSLPQTGRKADPAVYRSANDEEDDSILFTNAPCWNQFSVVLRDKGTLRFVKCVSQASKGDRWDIKGEVELSPDAFGDDEDEDHDLGEDNENAQDDDEEEIEDGGEDEDEDADDD